MNLRALPRELGPKDPDRMGMSDSPPRGVWEGDELPRRWNSGSGDGDLCVCELERREPRGTPEALDVMELLGDFRGWPTGYRDGKGSGGGERFWTERTRDLLALPRRSWKRSRKRRTTHGAASRDRRATQRAAALQAEVRRAREKRRATSPIRRADHRRGSSSATTRRWLEGENQLGGGGRCAN